MRGEYHAIILSKAIYDRLNEFGKTRKARSMDQALEFLLDTVKMIEATEE